MASTIGSIKDALITQIDTTSVTTTIIGFNDSVPSESFPYAQIMITRGQNIDTDLNNWQDVQFNLEVFVISATPDEVDQALEEVSLLFSNSTNEAALKALGVINIFPFSFDPAVVYEVKSGKFIGSVTYGLLVRYSYT